jgi:hypothetical protein
MKFLTLRTNVAAPPSPQANCAILRPISWDDYGHRVLFHLSRRTDGADELPIGLLKILRIGAERPALEEEFEQLDGQYCSMGQGPSFYSSIRMQADAREILVALRDLTVLPEPEQRALTSNDQVQRTLLRTSSARFAYAQEAGEIDPDIRFRVSRQVRGFAGRHEVTFHFSREQTLGRMVVLVGENGTGKTQFLNGLIHPTLGISDPQLDEIDAVPPISRLILLSFGAFDRARIPRHVGDHLVIPYDYCGLRRYVDPMRGKEVVDMQSALHQLGAAYDELVRRGCESQWQTYIGEYGMRPPGPGYFEQWVEERSAGQKFVCFVLTNLLAKLEPGALVVFDEPEIHTHPRMLSTLMRHLVELLQAHDAFAIVATHSPIVLQEVPARQVRVFRVGGEPERPLPQIFGYPRECFAEALDEIVKSGFGLEIPDMNYMRRLRELVREQGVGGAEAMLAHGGLSAQLAIALAENLEATRKRQGGGA